MIPLATYRLQFHKDFRFEHAMALTDYFEALGVSHIYASPIMTARAGSTHGYDVIDYSQINPQLGGEHGFRRMAETLRSCGLGIILDIVPNHMAVGRDDNRWWLDVLSNGRASGYAEFFDIDWDAPGLENKVLAPFLAGTPEELLKQGELKLVRDADEWSFAYYDHRFPVRPEDSACLSTAPALSDGDKLALLARQHYLLTDWREADKRINWRRFFNITGLAAVRMENDAAFDAVHAKALALYADGLVDGFRVDHIDGLADPRRYCRKLRGCLEAREHARQGEAASGPAYLIVEKILAENETLPADWLVDGTTGYDFMEDVAALLHVADPAETLTKFWMSVSGRTKDFEPEELAARGEVLGANFAADRAAAARAIAAVEPGLSQGDAQDALSAILERLRCYRTYSTGQANSPPPGAFFDAAFAAAGGASSTQDAALDRINHVIRGATGEGRAVLAVRRFNQLAAPVAAKAVEDTAFYRYGRLLSRNDVGFDPRVTSISAETFHSRTTDRSSRFPNSMLTTATHDHKRGEDARARLAVLSEIPDLWRDHAEKWFRLAPRKLNKGDVYHLLQTLVGAWPPADLYDQTAAALAMRIGLWCQKHLREAKLRSAWVAPNTGYEEGFVAFSTRLLMDHDFRHSMDAFISTITPAGLANSLAQTVLHMTVPGVPDLYQGRERWDFSLVDPDNRSPVDFDALKDAQNLETPLVSNPESWRDGLMKHVLVSRLLAARRRCPDIFTSGSYEPVAVVGPRAQHAIAFLRRAGAQFVLVVTALRCADALCGHHEIVPPRDWWSDTELKFDFELNGPLRDLLADTTYAATPRLIADVFEVLPVAVLISV